MAPQHGSPEQEMGNLESQLISSFLFSACLCEQLEGFPASNSLPGPAAVPPSPWLAVLNSSSPHLPLWPEHPPRVPSNTTHQATRSILQGP